MLATREGSRSVSCQLALLGSEEKTGNGSKQQTRGSVHQSPSSEARPGCGGKSKDATKDTTRCRASLLLLLVVEAVYCAARDYCSATVQS